MTHIPPPPRPPEGVPLAPLTRPDAESLGERVQQQAAVIAEATCELLLMVGDFDARNGVGWFVGLKSTAHWLAWSCSMSPGTAREHVRVARALPSMPAAVTEFRAGRLSYSKVREITRVADRVDETLLVELARSMTASQLARTISSFRAVDGSRLGQDAVRQARWQVRDDGMIEIRAVLPAEMGAEVITALDLALDRDGTDPEEVDPAYADPSQADPLQENDATERAAQITSTPTFEQRKADALVSIARTFLDTEPDDRSGEDRHLVIVQVSAEALVDDVPAGTPLPSAATADTSLAPTARSIEESSGTTPPPTVVPRALPAAPAAPDVPAGTPDRCGVLGMGPLEVRTAERLVCTGKVAITITDAGGEILHLGRSRRLASRAQRRALRLRDTTCAFPGCHQSQHLDAHHTVPWSEGGPTDIEGLALLCRRHHVMVHEGGLRLVLDATSTTPLRRRFEVVDSDGRPVQARWPAMLEHLSIRSSTSISTADDGTTGSSDSTGSAPPPKADPERIAATTGGAGFRLADCVDALCQSVVELAA
ncbi:HNH endonuclease signature motif containing protein [Brachybacterium sp. FME24]|uniref:HNH endonuclease signature motif containing protein n=1 Tax=Brachybacterium sp. FME24 TaxID=2742605 RepID=UPI001865CF31|nr:HNH endonuclease signature motif containing protein [Brachybacterium sp. FME24]